MDETVVSLCKVEILSLDDGQTDRRDLFFHHQERKDYKRKTRIKLKP